jgi:hypothetical protein
VSIPSYQATTHNSPCKISERTICLHWDRTRRFGYLHNLGVILTPTKIGVTVGEAENPRHNIPKGLHSAKFPWVPTNPGSQPYDEVCQGDHAQKQANDNNFLPAFFRITVFYIG